MKIKNLFLLLLLLVGFASCSSSNDEDEIPEQGKASLTLKLVPQGGYEVKAETDDTSVRAWSDESKMNSDVILVFRSDDMNNPLVYSRPNSGSPSLTTAEMPIGTKVSVYAFVNLSPDLLTEVAAIKSEDQLPAFIEKLSIQKTSNLTMASTEPATMTLANGRNELNVNITRLVSRIQISSIKTEFIVASSNTVRIDKLELANVKNSSLLYAKGEAEVKESKFAATFLMQNQVKEGVLISNNSPLTINRNSDELHGQNTIPYGYVFENMKSEENRTQLILTATLLEGKKEITKKFTVTVNSSGSGTDHKYIKRNYIYDLGLTFNDKSFDMAALVVKVTVVPWGKVHQVSEVD